jgi:hypothetical protein
MKAGRHPAAEVLQLFHSSFDVQRSMFGVRLSESPMTPRPFHRWKSFWFGVLILAFLGWVWASSVGYRSEMLLPWDAYKNLSLIQANGRLLFVRYDGWNQTLGVRKPKLSHHPHPETRWWQPAVSITETGPSEIPGWSISVAHWFLILLFLILWTACLFCRSRRMKRFAVAVGEPQP